MARRDALVTLISHSLRPLVRQHPFPQNPDAILVLKPCCLGDVVNATPALAALRRHFPETRIDVAVGRWSRPVLANNPHVDRLLDSGPVGQGPYTLVEAWQLARRLSHRRYEAAIVLDRSPLIGLVPLLAGIPHRAGLDSRGRGFAHTRRVPVPRLPIHEASLYLACVEASHGLPAASGETGASGRFWTGFYPAAADRQQVEQVLAEAFKSAGVPGTPFDRRLALLHPAGGVNPGLIMLDKRWPASRFATLGDRLLDHGLVVALTGTEAEAQLCVEVALQMKRWPLVLAGQLDLAQFGALCQRARIFVGGDTGATHVAAACGCPTAAIFGPSDPTRYAPFAPPERTVVLWRQTRLPGGGVTEGQPQVFDWAEGVTVDEVWEACLKLLGGGLAQDLGTG